MKLTLERRQLDRAEDWKIEKNGWTIEFAVGGCAQGDSPYDIIKSVASSHVESEINMGEPLSIPEITALYYVDDTSELESAGDTAEKLNKKLEAAIIQAREEADQPSDYKEHNTHWGLV